MLNILIADDEQLIRNGIQEILKTAFPEMFRYYFAADGEEVISVVKNEDIDILISDIKMPKIDGLEALKIMSSDNTISFPLTIMISAYSDFSYARSCIRYGVKDYLLKPIERKKLIQLFHKMIKEFDLDKIIKSENMPDETSLTNKEKSYIKQTILYVEEHYSEDINMAVISNNLSIHYNYFSALFSKYYSRGFNNFIHTYRIKKAKALLENTDYRVFEIASMVGYKDPRYFVKKFSSIENISPLKYKRLKEQKYT